VERGSWIGALVVRFRKNYSVDRFFAEYVPVRTDKRILNAGSSSVRYGEHCLNIDIRKKPNVDLVCDIHHLPDSVGAFDVIVCNAVLQYCDHPEQIAEEFERVLNPGGYLFVDAPWVQPSCWDTPDRFRYSDHALISIFSNFEIVKVVPSIPPGSAFAMQGVEIAKRLTRFRSVNRVCAALAIALLFPFSRIRTTEEATMAGAFAIVCRKRPADAGLAP
jgi:SAM-dependent methyltransferase